MPVEGKPQDCMRESANKVATGVPVEPGTVIVANRSTHLKLRRFGDAFSINAGELSAGVPTSVDLPTDSSPQPWLVTTDPLQPLKVCDPDPTSG
jgi:hypothetical protein